MKMALDNYKTVTDELREEVMTLRNDNEQLRTKIKNIETNIDTKKQQKLEQNFIINGIQEEENENLPDIVTEIARSINVDLTNDDIISTERSATCNEKSGLPKTIIVKLNNKSKRDLILKNKRNLIHTRNDRPIFITEQLTSRLQFILKKARDLKREKKTEFTWVKNGKVYIRKKTDSPAVNISDVQQLKIYNEPRQ